MQKIIVFIILIVSSISVKAQDVLSKINDGASWMSGVVTPIKVITTNYTLDESDYTVVVRGTTPPTITLPTPNSVPGRIYRIVRNISGNGTISSYLSNTGFASTTYSHGNVLVLQSDDVANLWRQVN